MTRAVARRCKSISSPYGVVKVRVISGENLESQAKMVMKRPAC